MRINVYSQEMILDVISSENLYGQGNIPPTVEHLEKRSNTGALYSAVRMFLHSSGQLHHPPQDDDRSAITWWLPKSPQKRERMAQQFEELAYMIRQEMPETGMD